MTAQEVQGRSLDPDCRSGKHLSCVGDMCGCPCHRVPVPLAVTEEDGQ